MVEWPLASLRWWQCWWWQWARWLGLGGSRQRWQKDDRRQEVGSRASTAPMLVTAAARHPPL